EIISSLLEAAAGHGASQELKRGLADQLGCLAEWDRNWSTESVGTTLAVLWGEAMLGRIADPVSQQDMALRNYFAYLFTGEMSVEMRWSGLTDLLALIVEKTSALEK